MPKNTYELIIEVSTKEEADTICDVLAQNGLDHKIKIIELTPEIKAGRGEGSLPDQDF